MADSAETYYMYVKNLQGDVVAVADESGTVLVEYIYSAYGEFFTEYVTSNTSIRTILDYSPFRYRGYMYDEESGFYYLNSRYYDPQVGRFVNADSYVSTGQGFTGYNMFAYCGNNPVMFVDPSGDSWEGFISDLKSTFGAGATTSYTSFDIAENSTPWFLPVIYTRGAREETTVSTYGDASKPISVYANGSLNNPILSSSAGLRINISKFTVESSLALDDYSTTYSWTEGNVTNSVAIKNNFTTLRGGIEFANSVKNGNTTTTYYHSIEINGGLLVLVAVFVSCGQILSAAQPAAQPAYS